MTTTSYLETAALLGLLTGLIVALFSGSAMMNLFSNHTPIEERIRRLLGNR